jgi:YacP-like NYN domain
VADLAGLPATAHLVVDAMNVIGSRPDGWWRDRPGAVRGLVEALGRLASETHHPVTVVVDGRPLVDLPEGDLDGVAVAYARRAGRDAADDRIVELLGSLPGLDGVVVVTSDRGLAERARSLGAGVVGAGTLRRALDELD